MLEPNLPTLYEHYTSGGIKTGLNADTPVFKLNDREIFLYSGAMHYFRVPKQYWRDRLRKIRAAGLNAVETYIPWNLHEFENGTYDFGKGGSDFQDFLNVEEFLKTAQEEDLLAIVRPGPFICAEWEFGGLPSFLLREKDIKVRTKDNKFMKYVERYFKVLLPILAALQFTKGGPIIAFQIENEYGNTILNKTVDHVYLDMLKDILIKNGIVELLFTSDPVEYVGNVSQIPGVLMTANFQRNAAKALKNLTELQPNKPLMAMEYWTGWFDSWGGKHYNINNQEFENRLKLIITYPASVNFYMFHGGTNWGFLNGAIINKKLNDSFYASHTTSYDYNAPLTENGDYTEKYYQIKAIIETYNKIKTKLPQEPQETPKEALLPIKIIEQLTLEEILTQLPSFKSDIIPMELLPINNNSGQSYGYIIYRKTNITISPNSILKISGHVCDTVMVLINGILVSKPLQNNDDLIDFGYSHLKDSTLNLGKEYLKDATLDLVVENWGRVSFGKLAHFVQFKGLWQGPVSINGKILSEWDIFPLEFKKKWTTSLKGWQEPRELNTPAIYRAKINLEVPIDTFVDMRKWTKGIIIVNGFVLGRHAIIGPQMTLYLPAPLLNKGENEIIVFEHFQADDQISFVDKMIFYDIVNVSSVY